LARIENRQYLSMQKNNHLPKHIAIIMDGNGRWAAAKNLARIEGHRGGSESVDHVVSACCELNIDYLTLFAFSTENWFRSKEEVNLLMEMLSQALDDKLPKLQENNVRFDAIGRLWQLPSDVQKKIDRNKELTQKNTGTRLTLALSYGGRSEIVDGIKKLIIDVQSRKVDIAEISEDSFSKYLYRSDLPDPDLVIRTSGEMRVSNFLLWESAYSELYVTDVLWPDFRKEDLEKAIYAYQHRERRFGRTETTI